MNNCGFCRSSSSLSSNQRPPRQSRPLPLPSLACRRVDRRPTTLSFLKWSTSTRRYTRSPTAAPRTPVTPSLPCTASTGSGHQSVRTGLCPGENSLSTSAGCLLRLFGQFPFAEQTVLYDFAKTSLKLGCSLVRVAQQKNFSKKKESSFRL